MSNQGYYEAPPGPPPGQQNAPGNNTYGSQQQQQQQTTTQSGYAPGPGIPPRRSETFQEADFVPADQRGEQREMMEQFEMSRSKAESQTERDVATLQQEFPGVDGSLIAALYGDSNSLSATREMLHELAGSDQGK